MSVINQMLRDLQARELGSQMPAANAGFEMNAVFAPQKNFRPTRWLIALLIVVVIALGLSRELSSAFARSTAPANIAPARAFTGQTNAQTPLSSTKATQQMRSSEALAPVTQISTPNTTPTTSITPIQTQTRQIKTANENSESNANPAPVNGNKKSAPQSSSIAASIAVVSAKKTPAPVAIAQAVSAPSIRPAAVALDDSDALNNAARRYQQTPGDLNNRLRYAELLLSQQQYAAARAVLLPLPSPPSAGFLALLALTEQQSGLHQEAISHYTELTQIEPQRGQYWAGLAISLEQNGDAPAARTAWLQALRDPQLPAVLRTYGRERLALTLGEKTKHIEHLPAPLSLADVFPSPQPSGVTTKQPTRQAKNARQVSATPSRGEGVNLSSFHAA